MINSDTIFIPGQVPSLKNGKQWTGSYLVKSKTVIKYLRSFGIQNYSSKDKWVKGYKTIPDTFEPYAKQLKSMLAGVTLPYKLGFYFVRSSKTRFDFENAVSILADLFSAYDVWVDDNCDYFLPFPELRKGVVYHVDKNAPGVYIKVLK